MNRKGQTKCMNGRGMQIRCTKIADRPSQTQFPKYLKISLYKPHIEKVASNACGQFLKKLWTSFDKQQIFGTFNPLMPTSLSTIYPILSKDILCIGKNWNFGHFYMLRKQLILRTFLTLIIGLRKKINFFHVC